MRTGAQPILSVDLALVSLHRPRLEQVDLSVKNVVDGNPGRPSGARLFAADPAHRSACKDEGDGRVLLLGGGCPAFSPDSGVAVIPTADIVDRRGPLVELDVLRRRQIPLLVAPSRRRHVERVHKYLGGA